MLNKFAVIFILLITISSSLSVAQENKELDRKLKLYEENFIKSLDTEYEGIVEKSIYNTIVFKTKHPKYNFGKIITALKKVSDSENATFIRYQAQLAILFIENYSQFQDLEIAHKYSPEVYKEISGKIYNGIVAVN